MLSAAQFAYLNALGVDAIYVEKASAQLVESAVANHVPQKAESQAMNAPQQMPDSRAALKELMAAATSKTKAPRPKAVSVESEASVSAEAAAEHIPPQKFAAADEPQKQEQGSGVESVTANQAFYLKRFQLDMWISDGILVMSISSETERPTSDHNQLVANILKAIGVSNPRLQSLTWPMALVNNDDSPHALVQKLAQKFSAEATAKTGQGNTQASSPVPTCILFGQAASDLMLPDAGDYQSLLGSKIDLNSQLQIRIAHSLKDIIESPLVKAQTWSLIRDLRPSSGLVSPA